MDKKKALYIIFAIIAVIFILAWAFSDMAGPILGAVALIVSAGFTAIFGKSGSKSGKHHERDRVSDRVTDRVTRAEIVEADNRERINRIREELARAESSMATNEERLRPVIGSLESDIEAAEKRQRAMANRD